MFLVRRFIFQGRLMLLVGPLYYIFISISILHFHFTFLHFCGPSFSFWPTELQYVTYYITYCNYHLLHPPAHVLWGFQAVLHKSKLLGCLSTSEYACKNSPNAVRKKRRKKPFKTTHWRDVESRLHHLEAMPGSSKQWSPPWRGGWPTALPGCTQCCSGALLSKRCCMKSLSPRYYRGDIVQKPLLHPSPFGRCSQQNIFLVTENSKKFHSPWIEASVQLAENQPPPRDKGFRLLER